MQVTEEMIKAVHEHEQAAAKAAEKAYADERFSHYQENLTRVWDKHIARAREVFPEMTGEQFQAMLDIAGDYEDDMGWI